MAAKNNYSRNVDSQRSHIMDDYRHYKRKTIAEKLLADLSEKNYSHGSRIPSVRKLSAQYGISPLTVSRLLNDMTQCGKLYHQPRKGYFLAEKFPAVPHIGLLGALPQPPGMVQEILQEEAVRSIKDEITRQHLETEFFKYQDFASRSSAPPRLKNLNGMLIQGSYWDEKVWSKLTDFNGHIVIYDYSDTDDLLPVHRIQTNCSKALNEFFKLRPLRSDEHYIIVSATHNNALTLSALIKQHFAMRGFAPPEELRIPYSTNPEMEAYKCFSEMQRDWSKTFIFTLSGYFARGIHVALKNKTVMPDILSFDNLEAHNEFADETEGYFTAVERNLPEVYRRAVTLLQELICGEVREIRNIGINAELVIRKSIKDLHSENAGGSK